MSKIYIVETVSMFRMAYAIKADSHEEAQTTFLKTEEPREFGQDHVGETVFTVQEVTEQEYIEQFDCFNEYLVDIDQSRKLSYIMEKNSEG